MQGFLRTAAPLGLLLSLASTAHAQQDSDDIAPPCLSRAQITASVNPAVMMAALPRCLQEGRTQEAIDLYNFAGVFSNFDRQRVADESAHGVYSAMKAVIGESMGEEAQTRFNDALRAQLAPDKAPAYIAGVCKHAKRIGPPSYAPTYMLNHGMAAFTGKGGGLVPDFNPQQGWQNTLSNYLKCPG